MSIEKLGQYLVAVEDPRCSGKVEHRLVEGLVIAVCATIACPESWDDMALYGRSKLAWLRTFRDSWPENSGGWAGSGVLVCQGGVGLRAWGGV